MALIKTSGGIDIGNSIGMCLYTITNATGGAVALSNNSTPSIATGSQTCAVIIKDLGYSKVTGEGFKGVLYSDGTCDVEYANNTLTFNTAKDPILCLVKNNGSNAQTYVFA